MDQTLIVKIPLALTFDRFIFRKVCDVPSAYFLSILELKRLPINVSSAVTFTFLIVADCRIRNDF